MQSLLEKLLNYSEGVVSAVLWAVSVDTGCRSGRLIITTVGKKKMFFLFHKLTRGHYDFYFWSINNLIFADKILKLLPRIIA